MHLSLLLSLPFLPPLISASKRPSPDNFNLRLPLDEPEVPLVPQNFPPNPSRVMQGTVVGCGREEQRNPALYASRPPLTIQELHSAFDFEDPIRVRSRWSSPLLEQLECAECSDEALSLLWNWIDKEDLGLLKHYAENDRGYYKLGAKYFRKYGLIHVSQLNDRDLSDQFQASLNELIESLPQLSEDEEKYTVIGMLGFLGRRPSDGKFWGPPCVSVIKVRFLHAIWNNQEKSIMGQIISFAAKELSCEQLRMLQSFFEQYGVTDLKAEMDRLAHHWFDFCLGPPGHLVDSGLLDVMYESIGNDSAYYWDLDMRLNLSCSLLNFFSEVVDKNLDWFMKNVNGLPTGVKLALLFRKPELVPLVELPATMPSIEQVIPVKRKFSFEKAQYFQRICELYTPEAILKAMQADGNSPNNSKPTYSPDACFHLSVIAHPSIPIDPMMFIHLMPKGLSQDERQAWWNFFIRRTEPVSAATGQHRIFGMPIDLSAQKDKTA